MRDAIFPTARALQPRRPDDASREISWVRVLKARVPAFDALEPGDLAIIPASSLAVVAPGAEEAAGLVEAFARAQVPAVLFVDGEADAGVFDALEAAAGRTGLVAFRIARVDPNQLERSAIGFLVNRRAELDHQAAQLEGQLARLALLGRGLDVLAAAIGSFFGRAVVLEGRRGDPLAVHVPADVPEAAAAVSRYRARPGAASFRVSIPAAPGESGVGGRLVLLGDRPASELERVVAERIAALLALELARDAAVRQAEDDVRRGDPLPPDGPPWVVLVARQGLADDPDDIVARDATRAELRLLAPPRRLLLRGTSESLELRVVAATGPDDPEGLLIADRLAGFLRRTVALSRPFSEPGARPGAEARPGLPWRRRSCSTTRRPSPVLTGCPRTGCWATCAICPTVCARHGCSSRRSSSVGPRRSGSGWPRSRRCSSPVGSVRQPPGSGSTATRSPTGPAGLSGSAAGTCATRISVSP